MTALTLAADLIARHEDVRLRVYDDATGQPVVPGYTLKGHPTIGVGRCLDRKGISASESDALLRNDLADALEGAIDFAGPAWHRIGEARQAVLIDMAHNLGAAGLAAFVRFRLALQGGSYEVAAAEMMDSRWARQVGRRAVTLATMMRTGQPE